jgi:hypothetical protein
VDVDASAGFYERALGWTIRTRGDGSTAFDDTTSEVSGEWVLDRQPAGDAGVLVYVVIVVGNPRVSVGHFVCGRTLT